MKYILTLILLCVLHFSVFAQTENGTQHVYSKIETLLIENGTLLETTIEEIGTIGYSISIKLIRIKNLSTVAKNSGLLFDVSGNLAIVDADEMDLLIKSLTIIKEAANATRPVQTEIKYKSKTGLEILASFDFERKEPFSSNKTGERKWMYAIRLPSKTGKNELKPSDFMALCGFVEAAKSKM